MMKQTILFFLTILFLACGYNNSDSDIQKKYDQVMIIHDEVMPETSTIHRLKKKIRQTAELDSTALELIKELEDADEAMMSWMADFNPDKSASKEKQLEYLEIQKNEISNVSKQMKDAIQKARHFLDK